MTFQEFLEKYNGKYVEIAGSTAKFQCVDLANAYIREVLGLPIIEWTNAKDFPSKAGEEYDYILNTPLGVPKEGDLVVWGGKYGHIAIFIEGNVNSFRSFDQNYPTGSPCHVQGHYYNNVLGWLHPRSLPTDDTCQQQLEQCRKQVKQEIQWKNETWQELQEVKQDLEGMQAENMSYQNFQKQLAITLSCENDTAKILGAITKLIKVEDDIRKIQKDKEILQQALQEYKESLATKEQQYQGTLDKVNTCSRALQEAVEAKKKLLEQLENKEISNFNKIFWRFYFKVDNEGN